MIIKKTIENKTRLNLPELTPEDFDDNSNYANILLIEPEEIELDEY